MPRESFLGGNVPIPRQIQPFQQPQGYDPGELIMQAAQLGQQREIEQERNRLAAIKGITDAVQMSSQLIQQKRENDLKEASLRATAELHAAQIKKLGAETEGQSIFNQLLQREGPGLAGKEGATVGPRGLSLRQPSGINRPPVTAVNPLTGETMVMPPGARFVTPPGAKDAQDFIKKADAMLASVGELDKTLQGLPSGRVSGGVADVANILFGAYPKAKLARGLVSVLSPMTAKIIGGDVGNLSEFEQKAIREALPKISGTREEQSGALRVIRDILLTRRIQAEEAKSGAFKKRRMSKVEVLRRYSAAGISDDFAFRKIEEMEGLGEFR